MLRLSTRAAAIAAMVVASSLGTIALSTGVASASPPTVTCTGFSATGSTTSTAAVTGCNDPANTGGKGTAKSTENLTTRKGTATITWNKTGTTTSSFTFTLNPKSTVKCPKGDILVKEISTTTGGSGAALKSIPKGQVATVYLCANAAKKTTTLAPGQKYQV
jgi:hypothetical protein